MDQNPLRLLASRRDFLVATAATIMLCPFRAMASRAGELRRINLFNSRTGERLDTIYYVRGEYIPEEMERIDTILRDVRAEAKTRIDPRLIDIASATQYMLGHDRPFTVISGYRTPETNAKLRKNSRGVAKKSYHIKGMAMDLRMPGVSATAIEQIGKHLHSGGVGLYTKSNFVHLDSGPVRNWGS